MKNDKKNYVVVFDNLCTDDVIMHYYYDTEEIVLDKAWTYSKECSVCSEGNFDIYVDICDI